MRQASTLLLVAAMLAILALAGTALAQPGGNPQGGNPPGGSQPPAEKPAPPKPPTSEASATAPTETERGDLVNHSGGVTVPADKSVKGDVVAVGGDAEIHGKVQGNVVALNGSIHLYDGASVAGDCVSVGGKTISEPRAQVTGAKLQIPAPWAAGILAGPASPEHRPKHPGGKGADIVRFGQPVRVEPAEAVAGDVVVFGAPVEVLGAVHGDIVAIGGPVDVSGEVSGDTVAIGGPITLKPTAHIAGQVVSIGGALDKSPGAQVGSETSLSLGRSLGRLTPIGAAGAWLFGGLAHLIILLLVVAVVPRNTEAIAGRITHEPGRAAMYGLVGLLLLLPVLALLVMLVLTWVIIPVYIAAAVVLWWLGGAAVFVIVGRWIQRGLRHPEASLFVPAIVGFIALQLLRAASHSFPFGGLALVVGMAMFLFGFGGALMTWFGTDSTGTWWTRRMSRPAAPEQMPS